MYIYESDTYIAGMETGKAFRRGAGILAHGSGSETGFAGIGETMFVTCPGRAGQSYIDDVKKLPLCGYKTISV